MKCINKSSIEFIRLSNKYGEVDAELITRLYNRQIKNEGDFIVPTISQVDTIVKAQKARNYKSADEYLSKAGYVNLANLKDTLTGIVRRFNDKYYVVRGNTKLPISETQREIFDKELDTIFTTNLNFITKLADKYPSIIRVINKGGKDVEVVLNTDIANNERLSKLNNEQVSLATEDDLNFEQNVKVDTTEIRDGKYFITAEPINVTSVTVKGKLYTLVGESKPYTAEQYAQKEGKPISFIQDNKILEKSIQSKIFKNWEKEGNSYYIYKIAEISKEEQALLESIDDKKIRDLIVSKKKEIALLEKKIKASKNATVTKSLNKQKYIISKQIEKLQDPDNQTASYVFKSFFSQLEGLNDIINAGEIKDVQLVKDTLYGMEVLLDSYSTEDLSETNNNLKSYLIRLIKEASESADKKVIQRGSELVKQEAGINILNEDGTITPATDINGIASTLLSLSENDNAIVQVINKKLKLATLSAQEEFNINLGAYVSIHDKFKEYQKQKGIATDKIYDDFIETDQNGKRTGNIVSQFTHEYAKDKEKARKEGILSYITFIAKNESWKINPEKWEKRKKYLTDKVYKYDTEIPDNLKDTFSTLEQYQQSKINSLLNVNNPENVIAILKDAREGKKLSESQISTFYEYAVNNQSLLHSRGVEIDVTTDVYLSKQYAKLMQLPKDNPLRRYYDIFSYNLYEARRLTKVSGNNLPFNSIPFISREEDLTTLQKAKSFVTEQLTEKTGEAKDIDVFTGEILHNIPLFTFQNVSPDVKSYDLDSVFRKFTEEMYNFKYKSEVENDALALLATLKEQKVYIKDKKGNNIVPASSLVYNNKESNNFKSASYNVKAVLYGQTQETNKQLSNREYYDESTKQRLDELVNLSKTRDLNEDEIKEYNQLKGQARYITDRTLTNSLLFFNSVTKLGFNMFGGFTEYLQAFSSLMVEGKSGEFFDTKSALSGVQEAFKMLDPRNKADSNRISKIIESFNVIKSNYQEVDKSLMDKAFWQYEQANKFGNGAFVIAFLKSKKITDLQGKEHNLYDVLQVDDNNRMYLPSNFDQSLFTTVQDGKIKVGDYKIQLEAELKDMLRRTRDRNSQLDPIMLEKEWWGRIVGQFKSKWMFEQFNRRFGSYTKPNLISGKETEGYYRTIGNLFIGEKEIIDPVTKEKKYVSTVDIKGGIKKFAQYTYLGELLVKQGVIQKEELEKFKEHNIKRMIAEIEQIAALTLLMTMVGFFDDDDEEKTPTSKMLMTYAMNLGVRMQRDLTTYLDPASAQSFASNAIPLLGLFDKFFKLTGAVGQTVIGDPYIYEGTSREQLRVPKAFVDFAFPGMYSSYKYATKQLNLTQR